MGLFKTLQEQFAKIQQQNRESESERTAPPAVFDRMRDKIEKMQENAQTRQAEREGKEGGLFSAIKEKLEQSRRENEASPVEETAEASVFDRMREEIERLEKQKQANSRTIEMPAPDLEMPSTSNRPQESNPLEDFMEQLGGNKETGNIEVGTGFGNQAETSYTPPPPPVYESTPKPTGRLQVGSMGMIESNGGSLALRGQPNMGSATNALRVPHGASLRILDYTDQNKINLDGQICGWYKVEYNGQIGWLLDMYLR